MQKCLKLLSFRVIATSNSVKLKLRARYVRANFDSSARFPNPLKQFSRIQIRIKASKSIPRLQFVIKFLKNGFSGVEKRADLTK